jgi:cob(I)alamin adenosyltransferase
MSEPTKYYSADGDDGATGLLGKGRVKKYHPRPAAYGEVDETQAALGMARAIMIDRDAAQVILQAQRDLYLLMAELAATPEAAPQFRQIDSARVSWLEQQTDSYGARVVLPHAFTVGGDSPAGAALDFARTVARRAERAVVRLFDEGFIENADLLRYMNRLSSLLYVLSRYEDVLGGNSGATLAQESDSV